MESFNKSIALRMVQSCLVMSDTRDEESEAHNNKVNWCPLSEVMSLDELKWVTQ